MMKADLVFYSGNVHTMDPAAPRVRAVAVAGNQVLAVGGDAEMLGLLPPGGKSVDLAGRTVVPGFTDAHLHFLGYGLSLRRIDLNGVPSVAAALARVAERAAATPAGRWLDGRGWDNTIWEGGAFPSAADLDRVAPGYPTILRRKCGHIAWVNSAALDMAGIGPGTPDPQGGAIERDPATGRPTGIIKERAIDLVEGCIGETSAEEADGAIRDAMAAAHRAGLTGVHTMEAADSLRSFERLDSAGDLRLRVTMQIPEENLDAAIRTGLRSGFGGARLRIGGVKLFSDGSLGGRTAHMLEPYDDDPGNYGIAVSTHEQLCENIGKAARAGIASFVHAIGDAANRSVLDAIEASRRAGVRPQLRHRVEHVQVLHPADVPRFARLGVIASMQPIHCTQDMLMVEPRWGKRGALAYAWRSLIDSGAVLAFGSDAPVETLDVMTGIHAAVTRRRADGSPGADGWYGEQRISAGEAVRAYTWGAAYAAGLEASQGTLSPGKLADLAVLSDDIFTIDPMAIRDVKVMATLFDGQIVYGDL